MRKALRTKIFARIFSGVYHLILAFVTNHVFALFFNNLGVNRSDINLNQDFNVWHQIIPKSN